MDGRRRAIECNIFKADNLKLLMYLAGGGFQTGCVTEIAGQSGVGKTQLCLQLCANVQLPEIIGGMNGQCVYFDCNGGFSTKRLKEICRPAQEMAVNVMRDMKENVLELQQKNFLNGVFYRRIIDISDFQKALDQLVTVVLPNNESVKLLIVDRYVYLSNCYLVYVFF